MTTATLPEKANGNGATEAAKAPAGPLATLMKYCQDPETKRRMAEMLGQRSGAFLNSVINVVKNSKQLQEIAAVNPASIMSSAMVAASVNLPIDPALGFAAIVPYSGKNPAAQFQLMYKGLIQLAQRTLQYATMHEAVVYRDELQSYNPITGEIKFTDESTWQLRYAEQQTPDDVAGFYFYFRLKSGFEMARFLSFKEAMAHGRRFSKSYQNDIKYGKQTSLWSTMPLVMGLKTLIKMTLSKYGILSIEMQDALVAEGEDFAVDVAQHVDATVVEGPEVGGVEGLKQRMLQSDGGDSEAPKEVDKPADPTHTVAPETTATTATGATTASASEKPKKGKARKDPEIDPTAFDSPLSTEEVKAAIDGATPAKSKWVCERNPDEHIFEDRTASGKCPRCLGPAKEQKI